MYLEDEADRLRKAESDRQRAAADASRQLQASQQEWFSDVQAAALECYEILQRRGLKPTHQEEVHGFIKNLRGGRRFWLVNLPVLGEPFGEYSPWESGPVVRLMKAALLEDGSLRQVRSYSGGRFNSFTNWYIGDEITPSSGPGKVYRRMTYEELREPFASLVAEVMGQ